MAYRKLTWSFKDSKEIEIKWAGKYGAAGEKRAKKRKATQEKIAKQNQYIRTKKMRRLIKANFSPGDYWVTLKYPKGTRKEEAEYRKDLRDFLTRCRASWKRRGAVFRFIYRIEVGKRGGVHIHILCNRLEPVKGKPDTAAVLQELWGKNGRINYQLLTDYYGDGYQQLAEYVVKPLPEDTGQLSLFTEEEKKTYSRYSASRNLVRPEPEIKDYKRRTVRELVENGPKPTPGFYIDKTSVRCGVNPYTGLSYCHYIEYLTQERRTEKMQC